MLSSISSCTAAQSAIRLQQTAVNATATGTTQTAADSVTISEEARTASLLDGFRDAMGVTPNSDGSISIESIRECFENDTAFIEKQLNALYRELGISSDSEMEIDIQNGRAVVSGESPAAEKLAEAINSDPELLNTMRRASANGSALAAYEESSDFRAAYEDNPYAAVERYGYLLNDNRTYNITFTMKNGVLDVGTGTGSTIF